MSHEITDPQRVEALRAELDQLRLSKFDGNLTATARALGVTSAYLSDILKSKRGVGMKAIKGLARYTGRSLDSLVGGHALVNDRDDDFPARAEAVRIVEEAIRRVRAMSGPGFEGRGRAWWLLQIHHVEAMLQLEAEGTRNTRSHDECELNEDEASGTRPKVVLGVGGR